MAENKRASVNSRIATPRVLPAQVPAVLSSDTAIARAIGSKVKIITLNPPKTYEGYLFSAHLSSNWLSITPNWPPPTNVQPAFTILIISNIQSLSVVQQSPAQNSSAKAPQSVPSLPPLPFVDLGGQQARIQASMQKIEQEDARKGKGVTREAQDIFDALVRTLPTKWDGEDIVVLDEIVIVKPYRVEDVKAGKNVQAQMVQRIKKVLEAERKKIADRSTTAGPRKGG